MTSFASLRSRVRQAWRAIWPTLVVVGGAVTCDNPTAPRPAMISIAPVLDLAGIRQFSGLTVDNARIIVIRPPAETLAVQTFPFSPDSATITVSVAVDVNGTEDLTVVFQLLSGVQTVFTGSQTFSVTAGVTTPPTQTITPTFVGPGAQIASIQVSPGDSGATFGATVPFRVDAFDALNNPVSQFYVSWSTSNPLHAIDAAGQMRAGNSRGVVWVRAHTPTGIWDSTRITIAPVPSGLQVVAGSGQTGTINSQLSQQLTVKVIAADNGPVVGVPVTFAATSGGGSVNPTVAVSDTLGLAYTTATLGTSVGTNTFSATVSGVPQATFGTIATSGNATVLILTQQPTSAVAGVSIAPAVTVAAQDGSGNTVASFSGNITLAIGSNPGGGTLSGTVTAPAVSGVATFGNLSIDKAGNGYTLSATATGIANPSTSAGFNISPAAASVLSLVSGGGQTALPATQLPNPVVVKVADAFGNGITGRSIAFAVATGGGSVGTPAATTAANGQASTTWTLGSGPGAQSITATSAGLTGSPLTITATAANIGSTTVSPRLDTLTALGATRQLAAQARDQANNPVTGVFTWISRDTNFVKVNGSGLVTAVANGQAYVVVTEANSTKDSALIVVQQRIASVNVTPNARNIYLTRNFTFTAQAVDGNNRPVPGNPTFTWTSTAPSVATVNASTGLVNAIALGSTQIRATTGTTIGVSNVNVITPITRIAVVVDTVGATKTDTFSLASLGLKRRYRAIAHDTVDAVMSGLTFTWASSNGSVAVMNTTTGDTASVTSAANGFTEVRATAQGFTASPGAALTVSQVLAAVTLTPASVCVGVGGSQGVTPRGLDANNFPVATALTFTFATSAAAVATVSASGVVTGVGFGTANITATSGSFTSPATTANVNNSCAGSIFFATDTLSVGRGQSKSFPILISKTLASPLTVNLSATAFAHWSTPTVVIPAGQTAVNATLVGDSAGTTIVGATDGSGAGYAGDSSVARVTANMNLTSGSYAILANDIIATQVVLSDPSPAGGTYITFGYGTAGIASISPDPAFIPAGQLAADIQIRGLAAGTTTITPSAIGVNGTPSTFTAYPPVIYISTSQIRLGAGQYQPYDYVYTNIATNTAIPVTITSSDSNVITATSPVTIPANSNYAYFNTFAKVPGSAVLTISSPGWTANNTVTVISTTPRLSVSGPGSMFSTAPPGTLTIYSTDSTQNAHYRTSSLVVQVKSSDTTVFKVDTLVTIPPGQYYTQSARVIPVGPGSAYVIVTASGHRADSTAVSIIGPPLTFSWGTNRIGAGQEDYYLYVYTPNNVPAPLVVSLANTDSNIVGLPTTVTIPTNSNYVYFTARGKTPGSVSIQATATGFQAASAGYIVTSPRVVLSAGGTFEQYATPQTMTLYVTDSTGNAHYRSTPLTVTLQSTDTLVVATDTLATIPAGAYYTQTARATPTGIGAAKVLIAAAGHRADSANFTVTQPHLYLNFNTNQYGRRQHSYLYDLYVYTNYSRPVQVPVTLTQRSAAIESLSTTTPNIPAAQNYQYFSVFAKTNGVDTVIASSPGYIPDTAFVQVSTPRFINYGLPGSVTTTSPPLGIYVYATDSVGNGHYTSDTVVLAAVSSDSMVLRPTQPYFRILKDTYYSYTTVSVTGPGTASITYSDSAGTGYLPTTTNTVTVTGPSLQLYNGAPVLGMRQSHPNAYYVYTANAVATPLVVNLLSTGTRVATVPATVTIATGNNYAYFDVSAQDTVGTIQIQATATGYSAAAMNVQVTVPRFVIYTSSSANTTSGPQTLTIYATDANGNAHYPTENVVADLLSSAPGVASTDSTKITIVLGNYYTQQAHWIPASVGTSQISASDARAAQYKYSTGTANVSVVTPTLSFSFGNNALGIGQYDDQYVYRPDYPATPLTVSLTHTGTPRVSTEVGGSPVTSVTIPASQNYVYFRVIGASTGTDTLVGSAASPPHNSATGYTVVGPGRLDPISGWPTSLAVGDSTLLTMYARDPLGNNAHYVAAATQFTLTPNAKVEFRLGGSVIPTITIPAGQYYVQFYVKAIASGTGSASITATNYTTYTNTVTIP